MAYCMNNVLKVVLNVLFICYFSYSSNFHPLLLLFHKYSDFQTCMEPQNQPKGARVVLLPTRQTCFELSCTQTGITCIWCNQVKQCFCFSRLIECRLDFDCVTGSRRFAIFT